MTVINIGNSATDRATNTVQNYTTIDINSACTDDGVIESLDIYVNSQIADLIVCTFESLGNGVFRTRDSNSLGLMTVGLHSGVVCSLQAKLGDYIGFYCLSGQLEMDSASGSGYWRANQDNSAPGTYGSYAYTASRIVSLGGSGTAYVPPSGEQDVLDALDDIYANYYPATAQWLRENYDWEPGALILATGVISAIMLAQAAPAGVTLAQLQAELDARGYATAQDVDDMQTIMNNEYNALVGHFTDVDTAFGTVETNRSVMEGNLDAAITVAQGLVQADIAALAFATPTDVQNAVTTLTGEVEEGTAAVNLHTDTQLATERDAINLHTDGEVTAHHTTTDAKIDALAFATPTDVQNAVTTLTGEVEEGTADVLAAIAAIPTGEVDLGRWPGLAGATLGTPIPIDGGTIVEPPLDGVIIEITSVPPGMGAQETDGPTRFFRLGWVAFQSDQGAWDTLQWLSFGEQILVPLGIDIAAHCEVWCHPGVEGTITPWTKNP